MPVHICMRNWTVVFIGKWPTVFPQLRKERAFCSSQPKCGKWWGGLVGVSGEVDPTVMWEAYREPTAKLVLKRFVQEAQMGVGHSAFWALLEVFRPSERKTYTHEREEMTKWWDPVESPQPAHCGPLHKPLGHSSLPPLTKGEERRGEDGREEEKRGGREEKRKKKRKEKVGNK